jgi:benzylsuccinate CoA-transferase BbsF subunit
LSYEQLHRGQRSVLIDLSQETGRERFYDLVRVGDAVIANFSYGVLERLGIAYTDLRRIRPDIVLVSMTGFGDSGPERDYVAYGVTQEELCGIYALTGYPGERPLKSGSNVGDPLNGMHAVCALLGALIHRQRTGKGQYVELSQLESSLPLIGELLLEYQVTGVTPAPNGNRDRAWAPQGCYRCQGEDKWIAITCHDDREWQSLCAVMRRAELATDTRFAHFAGRRVHQDELDSIISAWTRPTDAVELAHILQQAGVPAGPVLSSTDTFVDRSLQERGFLPSLRHADGASRTYYGPLWCADGERPALRGPAPLLGEHQAAVIGDLLGLRT